MSAIHDRIAGVLRDAEEAGGLSLGELAEECSSGLEERVALAWWEQRVGEMRAHGYTVAEDRGVLYLVAERDVERVGGQSPDRPANAVLRHRASSPVSGESQSGVVSGDAGLITRASAADSLSADDQLFETPETPSAYREAAA